MPGAAEEESQDSAFLRQALLGAGIGAATPCPGPQIQPSSTTAVPVVMVAPPQGADTHHAVSTSIRKGRPRRRPSPPPTLRTVHLEGVGTYRQLLFELAEPLMPSAEEYAAYWPYISNAFI
jgi:hypothetical protein